MIWLILLLIFALGLLFWLPIRLEIDTVQNIYRANWYGLMSIWVAPDEEGWQWFFQVFRWKKSLKRKSRLSQKSQKIAPKSKRNSKPVQRLNLHQALTLFRNVRNAIIVRRLRLNWDTGDFVLNAWLYPVFRRISRGPRQFFINFHGKQELSLLLQTRLGLLSIAALRAYFTIYK